MSCGCKNEEKIIKGENHIKKSNVFGAFDEEGFGFPSDFMMQEHLASNVMVCSHVVAKKDLEENLVT